MHIPTVLSVKDVADRRSASRQNDRTGDDIRDLSRAETMRGPQAGRSPTRTAPLKRRTTTGGPITMLFALGGIALAILAIAVWHIVAAAFDWPEVRDFVAPTAAEARAIGWQALSERAAP